MLPKNSPPAPSNWEPQGFHCMRCSLGHRPLSDDSGPRDAAGSRYQLTLTKIALLNATTTSLLCSPASSCPREAGEPGETHGSQVRAGPHAPAHLWGDASPQPLPQGSSVEPDQPDRPGRSRVSCCKRSTVFHVLLSRMEGEPGGCWRSLAASLMLVESTPPNPSKFMDPRLQNDSWKCKSLPFSSVWVRSCALSSERSCSFSPP